MKRCTKCGNTWSKCTCPKAPTLTEEQCLVRVTQLTTEVHQLLTEVKASNIKYKEQRGQLLWDALTYLAELRSMMRGNK